MAAMNVNKKLYTTKTVYAPNICVLIQPRIYLIMQNLISIFERKHASRISCLQMYIQDMNM